MKCEWVQTNSTLYLYDELPDDARHEFEQHLAKCPECTTELNSVRAFQSALTGLKGEEPSPSLLAASRMHLQEALESAEQSRGWSRWTMDLAGLMHQLRFSPALAVVLLMIGFRGGVMAGFRTSALKPGPGRADTPAETDSASIASIQGITQ